MALEKITEVKGRGVYVAGNEIDTDRIIPARFMKCVTFAGLGEYLFYDVRKNEDGSDKEHPLNDERFAKATILLSGENFGCGSSREHAPQALYRYGFRGLIAESYAEIFFGNCTTLGIPCFCATKEDIQVITAAIEADPSIEVTLDVANERILFGDQSLTAVVRDSARTALCEGKWDMIGELREVEDKVAEVAAALPYMAK
ncbi:MAG: 3-isopropylmalate dehydratase small subunit [Opitutales bacterium]|jgi:3-isopropylmalate/(R)-2-methylmalate dehydratase small subunit|nr:3-isopropylmalate dehydratase small subunit [Opitutales bacterium]MBT5167272.1 3-isopropylmalate dehydratase small subunit [Opitutales bacterium]MBT5816002.1 3-isopropylmalate dehydratase small subunit [Opitutales bacterium]MBT6379894.1 3-isopropylmalate dehydratase small subunit [Opitutales bacterium]MBT7864952.1 3-isopropylmalate dehydratase small subunit [Opitutales bacterium]